MSIEVAVTAAPSNGGVANTSRIGLEAGGNNTRNERKAGKGTGVQEPAYSPASCSRGSLYYSETSNILNVIYCWYPWRGRRRRHAAEQRRIEQQRWGQYVEEEDEGYSVVLPSPPNSRRRARRSSRRNCAQDDLQECLNELENDDYVTGLDDNLDLHLALALSVSITEQSSIAHVQHIGSSHVSVVADMTYESLVQLEDVRCVASSAVVAALPVCCISIEGAAPVGQASEMCLICLGEYEHGDTQVKLPCHHGFHQACGAEWLLNYSKLCPVCKLDVTESAPIEATTCV
uniref:RING-type domain-containing protein n=2 Tax=Physcomitrium patens TaxID=3218 RepID=A0A7I4D1S1_PHYPA